MTVPVSISVTIGGPDPLQVHLRVFNTLDVNGAGQHHYEIFAASQTPGGLLIAQGLVGDMWHDRADGALALAAGALLECNEHQRR